VNGRQRKWQVILRSWFDKLTTSGLNQGFLNRHDAKVAKKAKSLF